MWVVYAFGSSLFAGITSILAKIGIKRVNSHLVTALRTAVVLVFTWLMVFIVGSANTISAIPPKSLLFLGLSGITTGASWICYFHALQLGDVNKVVPVDKSSTILTMLLAFLILREPLSGNMLLGMLLLGAGTYLMLDRKPIQAAQTDTRSSQKWLIYAILSAVFASLTAILGKIGIENVESNLGTALRTVIVLLMAWSIVFAQKKQTEIKDIDSGSWLFIILSGIATGLSWLCYYKALQDGVASIVIPIDKLSILPTVAFSYFILHEKLSLKSFIGLLLVTFGTLVLLIKF